MAGGDPGSVVSLPERLRFWLMCWRLAGGWESRIEIEGRGDPGRGAVLSRGAGIGGGGEFLFLPLQNLHAKKYSKASS